MTAERRQHLNGSDKDRHRYDDIMNLPHHVSKSRPRMPRSERAAQFSPFAALTGYDAVIREAGRGTEDKAELDEDEKSILNVKLHMLQERITECPEAAITYYIPDSRKAGGAYVTVSGGIKKIDEFERAVIMQDGTGIPIDRIRKISGEIFYSFP